MSFEEITYKVDIERRLRMAVSIIFIASGAGLFLYPYYFDVTGTGNPTTDLIFMKVLYVFTPIAMITVGIGSVLYLYLQSGFNAILRFRNPNAYTKSFETLITKESDFYSKRDNHSEQNTFELKLDEIRSILSIEKITLESLTENVKEKIKIEAGQKLLKEFEDRYESEAGIERAELNITQTHTVSSKRISDEIASLGRRGNINLILGVITTLLGLALLTAFLFKSEISTTEPLAFAISFIPRLTLVIFIEIFAYFFLRLYKTGLAEIKYFQNELTNLESKKMALLASLRCENSETLTKVIEILANTERNHILEKGQTTLELKKMQLEKNQFMEVAQTLASLVPKIK